MKLIVIILSLLSERYLIHSLSHNRLYWFSSYFSALTNKLAQSEQPTRLNQALILALIVLPPAFIIWLILYLFGYFLFGLVAFLIHLIVFYYCLGPENPFYPIREVIEENAGEGNDTEAGNYFEKMNGALFAVIFWYMVTGPVGVLIYRLIALCRIQPQTQELAKMLTDLLDWIPARITVLLYLLVGNFQKGIQFFIHRFLSLPEKNSILLSQGGVLAARSSENGIVPITYAESLVEHALILFLIILALITLFT